MDSVLAGIKAKQEPKIKTEASLIEGKMSKSEASRAFRFFHGQNIPRPQMMFSRPPDNSNSTPFIPLIRDKPNALTPLPDCT